MNYQNPVDFETYYFVELIEGIRRRGQDQTADTARSYLEKFLDFMLERENPLKNIELLASRPGTSDISIFFSDLIEKTRNDPPESTLKKIDDHAHDFLAIFNELYRDPHWRQKVIPDLVGPVAIEEPALSFPEYIYNEIRNQFSRHLRPELTEMSEPLENLLSRIENEPDVNKLFEGYRDYPGLQNLFRLFDTIYQQPGDQPALESLMRDFPRRLDELVSELKQVAQATPEEFRAFCQGEPLPEVSERKKEPPLDEIIEAARTWEKPGKPGAELSEEDRQLRWLLRDYLIHEVEELTAELVKNLNELVEEPQNETKQQKVVENVKVFKDLGQIHKYPEIDSISEQIFAQLNRFFKAGKILPGTIVEPLQAVFNGFIPYIDAVLNENEAQGRAAITAARDRFRKALTPEVEFEKLASFSDKELLQPEFEDVNSRYIARINADFDAYVKNSEQENLPDLIAERLQHIIAWYYLWQLPLPAQAAEALLEWFTQPELQDRARERSDVVYHSLQLFSRQLFAAKPEAWNSVLNSLLEEKEVTGEVDVTESLEAFRDVTTRQLRDIETSLEDETQAYDFVLNNVFLAILNQIAKNSELVKNRKLALICDSLLKKHSFLQNVPVDLQPETRKLLAGVLRRITGGVERLPEPIPANEIIQETDEFIETILEKTESTAGREGPEEPASVHPTSEEEKEEVAEKKLHTDEDIGTRESYVDEELRNVFKKEAAKYVDEIEEYIDQLEKNKKDSKMINNLGRAVHTLKGSAQMLNQTNIADLARPMEQIIDLILNEQVQLTGEFVPLYRGTISTLRKILSNEPVDSQKTLETLNRYIQENTGEKEAAEAMEVIAEESSAPEVLEQVAQESEPRPERETPEEQEVPAGEQVGEEDVIRLSEKDPELLEIFRSEALNNLGTVEEALSLIEKFTHDKKTLHSLDQAVHELRAAAKMLGFTEVGHLMDELERLVESINKNEPESWDELIPPLRKSIQLVRDLTENHQVPRENYQNVVNAISSLLKGVPPKTEKKGEKEIFEKPQEKPAFTEPVKKEKQVLEPSDQVLEAFIHEAREYLEDINFLLMKMEKSPDNEELSHHLMRSLHTLKGSASMVYQDAVERLAHLSEDIVEKFRKKKQPFTEHTFELLFEVVDELEFIVDSLGSGMKGKTRNYEDIVARLESHSQRIFAEPEVMPEIKQAKEPVTPSQKSGQEDEYFSITDEPEPGTSGPRDAFVRIHVNQMDNLLNEAAELVINHTQFKTQLDKFKNYLPRMDTEGKNLQNILWYLDNIVHEEERLVELIQPHAQNVPALAESHKKQIENIQRAIHNLQVFYDNFSQTMQGIKESGHLYEEQVHKITRLSTQIHEEIMQARLVPIAILFQRFHRPLRDLAKKHNKKVKLYLEGESTELDRILIEELYEPLLHVLRNAIDHGIESPAERKKAGKPEEGLIKIIATHERNFVNVEVHDNGRGIDKNQIKNRAIELGMLEKEKADELTDQEIFEFLMYPGFSTSKITTDLSGRGVGLDVVRKQIQKIKGDIRIYSEAGKSSRFLIRVPISLTVTQAMLVEVSGHVYAMPLLQVEETTKVTIRDLDLRDGIYYMRHRGGHLPVLYMSNLLKIREGKKRPVSVVGEYPVIIVQDEGHKVALLVDKIVHREEILVKSLGPSLQRVSFITGGSVLADGKVVLVLDVPQIVREAMRSKQTGGALHPENITKPDAARHRGRVATKRRTRGKRKIKGRKPDVLVVDDSLSIRKFLAGLLTQKGFQVVMAKNGYSALEELKQKEFDLMVTDLEMPHLSGYELIEQIRADDRWDKMPIIVLTGRASKHIHQLSMELGADEFVIKPFRENDLLEKIDGFLEGNA